MTDPFAMVNSARAVAHATEVGSQSMHRYAAPVGFTLVAVWIVVVFILTSQVAS